MNRAIGAGVVMLSAVLAVPCADARTIHDERYSFDLTWNAAVRMLHVDMGFAITERDRETGFVLFVFNDNGRTSPGSLEIVRSEVEGVPGTRVIVQLGQMPAYMEHFLITRLTRKLHDEFGEPPPPVHHVAAPPDGPRSDEPANPATPDGGASGRAPNTPGDAPQ